MARSLLLAGALSLLAGASRAFVIQIRSEEELADAAESYPALAVHFHDPADERSRAFAAEFRGAGRDLLARGVQTASVDRTSEDFQNVVEALGFSPAATGGGRDVQVYVRSTPLPAKLAQPVAKATDSGALLRAIGIVVDKNRVRLDAAAGSAVAGGGKPGASADNAAPAQPKPKPKPKATPRPQAKAKKADKSKPPPKGTTKPPPAKQPKQPKQPPQMGSDDDLLIEPPSSRVQVLTADSFDAAVGANALTLVKFYAPWCGHCKRMAPRFTAASTNLAPEGIALAKVDQTAHRAIGARYGVNSFPTLLIFEGGRMAKKYDGGRTQDEIEEYMRAYKKGETPKVWDPNSTEGDPNDACLQPAYALDHYGDCCGRGNFEKPGHNAVCVSVRDDVKARHRTREL